MSHIMDKKDERLVCSVQLLQNKEDRERVKGSVSEGGERVKDIETLRVFVCETEDSEN